MALEMRIIKRISNDDDEVAIYTDFIRVYDWAHVNLNIRDELKHIRDKVQKEEVMADISKLQLSKSKQIFEAALKLFMIKWKSFDDEGIDKFIDSFVKDYVNQRCGWYEAIAPYCPSTSNSSESTNKRIKDEFTFRERWPLGRFLPQTLTIMRAWSDERNPANINAKLFSAIPTLTTKHWRSAYTQLKVKF